MKKIFTKQKISIHGDQNGKIGSRFYLHARNQADGLLHVLNSEFANYPQKNMPTKYNIVGEKELNNLELAQMIAQIMGSDLDYEIVDFHSSRPGHDLRYALDGGKLKKSGWSPPFSIEESLETTVKWTLNNPQWLDI
jgi:dTDP-glucose 4,6-dehydratase